jgi:hypothetical protein
MSFVRRFVAFWYDFIVGDDWRVAASVVVLLAATGALAHAGPNLRSDAWLLMPGGVALILGVSLRRATARPRAEVRIDRQRS